MISRQVFIIYVQPMQCWWKVLTFISQILNTFFYLVILRLLKSGTRTIVHRWYKTHGLRGYALNSIHKIMHLNDFPFLFCTEIFCVFLVYFLVSEIIVIFNNQSFVLPRCCFAYLFYLHLYVAVVIKKKCVGKILFEFLVFWSNNPVDLGPINIINPKIHERTYNCIFVYFSE